MLTALATSMFGEMAATVYANTAARCPAFTAIQDHCLFTGLDSRHVQ